MRSIKIAIGIVILAIVIGLASPLFYETEIDEPLPSELNKLEEGLTFEKFTSMENDKRQEIVNQMPENVKDMIMQKAADMTTIISEEMTDDESSKIKILQSGEFVGLRGHDAVGTAKIIQVMDNTFLRFEDFQVTNGPDLRVYLTNDGDVKTGLHLEKLKGSKGNQNYSLENINFEQYDTVVIYCQPFGVHFGQATLSR